MPRKAKAKIRFLIHSTYTWDTPYQVWFNLDNLFTQSKITIVTIRQSQNSQISVWKPIFFARQGITEILFVLHFIYTGDTPYRVQFDLNNNLNQWKRPIFKFRISRNSESCVWITNLFHRQSIAKIFFLIHSTYTRDTPYHVWFNLNNSLNQWKRLIFKFRNSRNSENSLWKTNFFALTSYSKKSFPNTLYLHRGYSIPSLVKFRQFLHPIKNNYSYNSPIAKFSNFRMKTHLFC